IVGQAALPVRAARTGKAACPTISGRASVQARSAPPGGPFSSARVELAVDGLEAVAVHVGVVLRGADAGVAEQLLHRAQVGPAGEQVRGEAVPQRVRADARVEA